MNLHGRLLIRIATKNVTEAICQQPLRDRTKAVSVAAIIGISLAALALILRLLARTLSRQFGMDDWTMIAAMVWMLISRSYTVQ